MHPFLTVPTIVPYTHLCSYNELRSVFGLNPLYGVHVFDTQSWYFILLYACKKHVYLKFAKMSEFETTIKIY